MGSIGEVLQVGWKHQVREAAGLNLHYILLFLNLVECIFGQVSLPELRIDLARLLAR